MLSLDRIFNQSWCPIMPEGLKGKVVSLSKIFEHK